MSPSPLPSSRSIARRAALAGAGAALIAVATALGVRATRPAPHAPPATALVTAATRSVEARLAYGPADRHRPYDVARGAATREDVPLATLAALEAAGDSRGVAAGLALGGDRDRAAETLARAGNGVDVAADRAALLVMAQRGSAALAALDAVLAERADHPQALWNRGLALRDLGLPLAAAESFDRVAALGEPGWSDEARARAAALRGDVASRRDAWAAMKEAGLAMAEGGPLPPPERVRAAPEMARHFLYHALRAAPTRERALALVPLAEQLDATAGDAHLAQRVKRAAERDFARRGPLAATYARLLSSESALDAKEKRAYLAALRAAGEEDMWLGAVPLADALEANAEEYAKLAEKSGDPWFAAIAAGALADQAVARSDFAGAEEQLRRAVSACSAAHVAWRCALVQADLSALLAHEGRTTDARQLALAGLAASQTATELLGRMLFHLADVARLEDDGPLLRAYAREAQLAATDWCLTEREIAEVLASGRVMELDAAGAARALLGAPRCDQPLSPNALDVLVDSARMGASVVNLDAAITETRQSLSDPGDRAMIDVIASRWLFATKRANEAEARARRALVDAAKIPEEDVSARKAETYAHLTLAIEAARAGAAEVALDEIAAGAHATGTSREACTLGIALDGAYLLAAMRDVANVPTSALEVRRTHDLAPASLVPAASRARLEGCPRVRVVALAPLHGTSRLFSPEVAWGFASAPMPRLADAASPARLVVSDVRPPAALGLPKLGDWSRQPDDASWLHGDSATPSRVIAAMKDATEIEIHAHGFVDGARSAASVIALSPEPDGRYALTANDLRATQLRRHPVIVLGACHAAATARYFREAWSLPSALVHAGARAVFASTEEIRDGEAAPFFEGVLARIRAGAEPAIALRDERLAWLERGGSEWVRDVIDFE